MTYLELVNRVLRLLREPTVSTVVGNDDVVADIVSVFVNDAKRQVENAHTWNALRYQWDVTVAANADLVSLPGSQNWANVEQVLDSSGIELRNRNLSELRKLKAAGGSTGGSLFWAVDGVDASRDVRLRVYPEQASTVDLEVHGYKRQADLASDDDQLLVPHQPVVYYALALAARERGEVGGQTASEIFGMANTYLSDAIAHDVSLNSLEYDWYS